MSDRGPTPYGAAAGAVAIAMFLVAALLIGTPPDFDAPGSEVVDYLRDRRTSIQVGCAINAAWAPVFVWFLATVASLARAALLGSTVLALRSRP